MVFFLYITYVSDVGIDVILKNRLQIVSEWRKLPMCKLSTLFSSWE
jgi:hypothetical protein